MRRGRNILFLLIDCLRADMCFGEDRAVRTPVIDSLMKRGTSFIQTISVSTVTPPTVSTMLTGLYPFVHGVLPILGGGRHRLAPLNPRCVTLQEILRRNGYHTYAMVTGTLLHLGLDRGFEEYSYRQVEESMCADWGRQLRETIGSGGLREPWFLFLHLWELHMPRVVPRPFNRKHYGRNRYERALSCLDYHLRGLLDLVDLDRTIVFLHGDHGENYDYPPALLKPLFTKPGRILDTRLGIKRRIGHLRKKLFGLRRMRQGVGWLDHGSYLYEFLVRVPLIAVGKGVFPEAEIIDRQVSQIDILPTILDSVGVLDQLNQRIHGRSLMPLVEDGSLRERPVLLESRMRIGIRTPKWKLITDKRNPDLMEVYDLETDSAEDHNLAEEEEEVTAELKERLEEMRSMSFPELSSEIVEITGEERAELERTLRELGYL